jgi:hypothetical protein
VFTLLLLPFPTGWLPSPRWRPVAWASVASAAAGCVVLAVTPGPMAQVPGQPNNPLGIENAAAALDRIEALLNLCLALLVLVCAASVVVRFRRAGGMERQQLKWFAYGAGQLALLLGSGLVLGSGQLFGQVGAEPPSSAVAGATLAVAALFQPARRRIQQAVDRRSIVKLPRPSGRLRATPFDLAGSTIR